MEALPLHQVPPELRESAGKDIADFMVGLVRLYEDTGGEHADLGGSGTLIQVDESYGILTAHHVLKHLPETGEIGLLLPTRHQPALHRARVRTDAVRRLTVARGTTDSEGPDLGVLVLSSIDVGWIKAKKVFYNVSRRREKLLDNPRALRSGMWLLCGFAGEWTSERAAESGYARVMDFRGACGLGHVENGYSVGDFDYLEFEARYHGVDEPPGSFGGYSGAGLWQVPLVRKEGALTHARPVLSGVAFYQAPPREDRGVIRCHGRRSIYDRVVTAVRSMAA